MFSNHAQRTRPSRSGNPRVAQAGSLTAFTLIELLVVVAVIGVLCALLLPALTQAKRAGLTAKCKSNLHQLGIGLNLYTSDHGYFPPSASVYELLDGRSNRGDQMSRASFCPVRLGRYWDEMTYIYNNFPGWQAPMSVTVFPPPLGGTFRAANGGFDLALTREDAVRWPTDMIAFTDGAYYSKPYVMQMVDLKIAGDYPWTGLEDLYPHSDGVNQLFCDGHVETVKRAVVRSRSDIIRSRWFSDRLPHRELVP